MKVKVWAKLNLSLNVFPRESNGFHPVDSVAISVNLGDTVSVKPCNTTEVTLSGCKNIPVQQNVAYKAARAFVERFGTNGCKIKIKKRIPIGSGLGGSSADAAAVICCLCRLYGVEKNSNDVKQLCAQLGSDVYFMLFGGVARLTGKGEEVAHLDDYPDLFFAVTFFDKPLLTKDVYERFDELAQSGVLCNNDVLTELLQQRRTEQALQMFSNGLQNAANSLSNFAQDYLQYCADSNLRCNMTGSGSAFYIAFPTLQEAKLATKMLNARGFKTKCLSYVSWGVQTTNFLFHVV